MTCLYQTSLDRACGRPADGRYCDFHWVLAQLEDADWSDPNFTVQIPESQRPLVERLTRKVLNP